MKLRYIFVLFASVVMLSACDPNDTIEDYTIEYTSVGEMLAGEWYVTYTLNGEVKATNSKITTSNTADDRNDQMWVTDHDNYYGLQAVVNCDVKTNTFSVVDADELIYDVKVDISNGKVIPNGGTTAAGNVTDSIYMEVEFSDSPGDVYILAGVRRTGFLEDEHE